MLSRTFLLIVLKGGRIFLAKFIFKTFTLFLFTEMHQVIYQ